MPVEDCENNNSQESLEQDFKEKLDLESESRHVHCIVQLECIWMMMVVMNMVMVMMMVMTAIITKITDTTLSIVNDVERVQSTS